MYSIDSQDICSQLRTGDYVFIEGRPCQIITSTISEGSGNVLIRGIDLFSEVQREGTYHLTETMDIPIVSRTVCRLVGLHNGLLQLVMPDSSSKNNIPIPKGLFGERIGKSQDEGQSLIIIIQSVMDEENVIDVQIR
ncbi:translation initiation factor eIF5A [Talaromyces marneffei ATCC 18224]